jgi:hypothetical protein
MARFERELNVGREVFTARARGRTAFAREAIVLIILHWRKR